jgi:type IV secretion system protein TrbL
MNFNLLTSVLTTIVKGLAAAQGNIGKASGVMSGLAIIEIVLAIMWWTLDGASLSEPFRKLLQITFWVWFATHFPALAKFFSDSLVQIALTAGGQSGNVGLLLDPSQIAGMALDATLPLVQSIHDAGIGHLADIFLMGTAYLVLIACFFIIACHVALAVIEYYLVVTLATCLIPFGISQHTRFLAEKAIGAVVAVSVKLMVLSFIIALIKPVMAGIHFSGAGGEILLNEALSMCLVCVLLAIVVWRAPGLASDLLAASPSLSAGQVGQHITSSVTSAAALYAGAAGIASKGLDSTKAAAGGAKTAAASAGGAIQKLTSALRGGSGPAGAGPQTSAAASGPAARTPPASSPSEKKRA